MGDSKRARPDRRQRQSWRTPRVLGRSLVARHRLDLDAAASASDTLCPDWLEDSLSSPWDPARRVWCNPPFSLARHFSDHADGHFEAGGYSVMLVLDRGTLWLEDALRKSQWYRFRGRVQYESPDPEVKAGGVTFGSVLVVRDPETPPGFRGWLCPRTGESLAPLEDT